MAIRVGLAWCDNTVGQHEIYFEPFDFDGRLLDPPQRVTNNATESFIPAIQRAGNGFALVWNEFTPGPSGDTTRAVDRKSRLPWFVDRPGGSQPAESLRERRAS